MVAAPVGLFKEESMSFGPVTISTLDTMDVQAPGAPGLHERGDMYWGDTWEYDGWWWSDR